MERKQWCWWILIWGMIALPLWGETDPFVPDVDTLCAQKRACYGALEGKAIQLAVDIQQLIAQWESDSGHVAAANGGLEQFEYLLQIQITSCQEKYLELLRQQEGQLVMTAQERELAAQGPSLSSNIANFFKDSVANSWYRSERSKRKVVTDAIVTGALAVPAVSQNLTPSEVKSVAQEVVQQQGSLEDPYMHAFSLSKSVYLALVQKIVAKNIQENGIMATPAELRTITREFERCLSAAQLEGQLNSCVEKFLPVAPIRVGRLILAKNIDQYFRHRFPPNFSPEQWMAMLTKETEKFYLNCVVSWYEAATEKNAEMIRTCVFEAIMAGMLSTANHQIDFNLQSLVGSGLEMAKIKRQIFTQSTCTLKNYLEKLGKLRPADYQQLASLHTDRFTHDLMECGDAIELQTAPIVIQRKVKADPAVMQAFASQSSQLELMIDDLTNKLLQNCLQTQKKAGKVFDTSACKPLINAKVTAEVVAVNLNNSITEQQNHLQQDFSGLREQILRMHYQCEEEVQQDLFAALASSAPSVAISKSTTTHLECAALVIGKMAAELVVPILEKELHSREELQEYAITFSMQEISELQEFITRCYRQGIGALNHIGELSGKMPAIGEHCGLGVNKMVLPKILRIVLESKLQEYVPDNALRSKLVAQIMAGAEGWEQKITQIKDAGELKGVIEKFQKDATWQSYAFLVAKNAEEMFPLQGKDQEINQRFRQKLQQLHLSAKDQQQFFIASTNSKKMAQELAKRTNAVTMMMVREIIKRQLSANVADGHIQKLLEDYLLGKMELCLQKNSVEFCQQYITAESYYQIGGQALADNIVFMSPKEKQKLTDEIYQNLQQCFAPGKLLPTQEQQRKHYENCLGTQSIYLAQTVGDSALRFFREAMGGESALAQPQAAFARCLRTIEKEQLSKVGMEQMKNHLQECAHQLEKQIKQNIRTTFLAQERPLQRPQHRALLGRVLDSFFALSASATSSSKKEVKGQKAPASPQAQLEQLGNSIVLSCNYDFARCQRGVNALEKDFAQLAKKVPFPGQEEINQAFFQGPLMDLVIDASLSSNLLQQFKAGLGVGEGGKVADGLEQLFGVHFFSQVLQTPKGKALKAMLLAVLSKGDQGPEQLSKDPMIRRQVVEVLTANSERGGFSERLLGMIIQEKLDKMQANPSFTLSIGNLLGIIDFRHFQWDLIVATPEGKAAINYFQKEILVPKMLEEKLSPKEWQQREQVLENYISVALRSLQAQEVHQGQKTEVGFGDRGPG